MPHCGGTRIVCLTAHAESLEICLPAHPAFENTTYVFKFIPAIMLKKKSVSLDRPMAGSTTYLDVGKFFRSWLADPKRVASVVPSSAALARAMTREITAQTGPILELGPGTGVFTRALLDRGVAESALTLIEYDPAFAAMLRTRFPEARVLRMDAAHLSRRALFADAPAGAVISGLPFLSMPPRKVMGVLNGAFSCLRPDGAFYQFTYGPSCPVPDVILERLDLRAVRIGRTLRNIPPATVYRLSRWAS